MIIGTFIANDHLDNTGKFVSGKITPVQPGQLVGCGAWLAKSQDSRKSVGDTVTEPLVGRDAFIQRQKDAWKSEKPK